MTESFPLTAPRPEDNPTIVARTVRGHTLGAIEDGWLVYYYDLRLPPGEGRIDKLCVIELADGRNLIRKLRRGRKAGRFDLFTVTGPEILDAEIIWAQPVIWIKPHVLSDEEAAQLEAIG